MLPENATKTGNYVPSAVGAADSSPGCSVADPGVRGGHKCRPAPQGAAESRQEAQPDGILQGSGDRLSLNQLREARSLTQTSLEEVLGIPQANISRLERRTDMYVSTLRNYIRAKGGELKITAVFPNGAVEISQFQDVEQEPNR